MGSTDLPLPEVGGFANWAPGFIGEFPVAPGVARL